MCFLDLLQRPQAELRRLIKSNSTRVHIHLFSFTDLRDFFFCHEAKACDKPWLTLINSSLRGVTSFTASTRKDIVSKNPAKASKATCSGLSCNKYNNQSGGRTPATDFTAFIAAALKLCWDSKVSSISIIRDRHNILSENRGCIHRHGLVLTFPPLDNIALNPNLVVIMLLLLTEDEPRVQQVYTFFFFFSLRAAVSAVSPKHRSHKSHRPGQHGRLRWPAALAGVQVFSVSANYASPCPYRDPERDYWGCSNRLHVSRRQH